MEGIFAGGTAGDAVLACWPWRIRASAACEGAVGPPEIFGLTHVGQSRPVTTGASTLDLASTLDPRLASTQLYPRRNLTPDGPAHTRGKAASEAVDGEGRTKDFCCCCCCCCCCFANSAEPSSSLQAHPWQPGHSNEAQRAARERTRGFKAREVGATWARLADWRGRAAAPSTRWLSPNGRLAMIWATHAAI